MPLLVAFAAGGSGPWRIESIRAVSGEALPAAARLSVLEGPAAASADDDATWVLRGVTSNERYVTRPEHDELAARQEPIGRAESTSAALIPIKSLRCGGSWPRTSAGGSLRKARITSPRGLSTFPRSPGACIMGAI